MAFPTGSIGKPVRMYVDLAVMADGSIVPAGPPVLSWQATIPGVPGVQQMMTTMAIQPADAAVFTGLLRTGIAQVVATHAITIELPPVPKP